MESATVQLLFSAKLKNTPPQKPKNIERRSREHLTTHEVELLIKAARQVGRHGERDAALILLMFRHGLRVSELISLRWDQVDLKQGLLYLKRLKQGLPATHPLRGIELRTLRKIQRDYVSLTYLFISERLAPLTCRTVRHIVMRAGELAGFTFPIHPHMLRHSTGFYLANKGHDTRAIQAYLGHANIQNTLIYTEMAPNRFNDFWQD